MPLLRSSLQTVELRRKLGLKPGHRIRFVENKAGEFVLKPQTRSIMDLEGCAKCTGKPITIDKMKETISQGWAGLSTSED
ncbi:MAG: hypothetical protein WCE75_05130 [Terracidiphilus sp.]